MKSDITRNKITKTDLTYVVTQTGERLIESKDRFYTLNDISEALGKDARRSKVHEVLSLIENGLVDSEGAILNEVRYDWNHIDPRTGLPKIKERPEDKIHLMNQYPGRSGWIILLQNRINLNSVGNIRYGKKMWYDRTTHMVSEDETGTDAVHFRTYILPGAGRPQGWIEPEIFTQYTNRRF